MAFTTAEKAQIARALGVPVGYADSYIDLSSRITKLEAVSAHEDAARVLLTDMSTIETRLRESWDVLVALRVGEIQLAHRAQITALRSEGTRLARQLAGMLDLSAHGFPLEPHVFSGGGAGMGRVSFG